MARDEAPFLSRGMSFYGPNPSPAIDSSNLKGGDICGREWEMEDVNPNTGAVRGGARIRVRAVRNNSGVPIGPKTLVRLDPADPGSILSIATEGPIDTTPNFSNCVPLDEFLPALTVGATAAATTGGLQPYDIGLVVIRGPATVRLYSAAGDVTKGDPLIACTLSTVTNDTTAISSFGRCTRMYDAISNVASATLGNILLGLIGRAMSTVTSAAGTATTSDMLVFMDRPVF